MAITLINKCVPSSKEAHSCVWGSLPPLVRSQHEFSALVAEGRTRQQLWNPRWLPSPTPPPDRNSRRVSQGLRRRASDHGGSAAPCASWVAEGRLDPAPRFVPARVPRPTAPHSPSGPLGIPAQSTSGSLCAGAQLPPPPPASVGRCPPHSARTITRPAGWAAPATARVEPRVLPETNLSRRVRGSALRVHEARKPAPVAALPPAAATAAGSSSPLRGPCPATTTLRPRRFPAPRDYRSCRGSVSGSGRGRGRREGGADQPGSAARKVGPSLSPAPPRGPGRGRPPRARLRCHGDHRPASPERARLKFPTLCPHGGRASQGDRVASLVVQPDPASASWASHGLRAHPSLFLAVAPPPRGPALVLGPP